VFCDAKRRYDNRNAPSSICFEHKVTLSY
jgi:hypothetical protein